MSEEPKLKRDGWRCPKCGDHYFTHLIHQGRPVCGTIPTAPRANDAGVFANVERDAE